MCLYFYALSSSPSVPAFIFFPSILHSLCFLSSASMLPNKRTFHDSNVADSAARKSRRRYVEETWVEAGASSHVAARRGGGKRRLLEVEGDLHPPELLGVGQRFSGGRYGVLKLARPLGAASAGSSDEDVVDSGGYDADVESGGASSSSSHPASTSELLTPNDAGESSQLKRRLYVEEIWFEAGAAASAVRRGAVGGGGKRRLVAVDEGNLNLELPVGSVKRFRGGWYGVLVSARPITAGDASTEAVDSGGYYADAE